MDEAILPAGEKPEAAGATDPEGYRARYEKLKNEFDAYRAEVAQRETDAAKERAFRGILQAAGVASRYIDTVVRATDLGALQLDETGGLQDAGNLTRQMRRDWADFCVTDAVRGADVPTPPVTAAAAAPVTSLADALRRRFEKKG